MTERQLTPGTCEDCGCTEEKPCEGGCSWTDASRTLCSRCGLARANACIPTPEELALGAAAPAAAAMQLGAALAQLQRALYVFEEVWGEQLTREDFDAAYGDVARLFGNVSESVQTLLEESRAGERRIVVP